MNAVKGVLLEATMKLRLRSVSARLDVELLLCLVLGCERSWLYANPDVVLSEEQLGDFTLSVDHRLLSLVYQSGESA